MIPQAHPRTATILATEHSQSAGATLRSSGVVSEDQHHRREEREERNGQQAGVEPPVASFKYPMA